MLAPGAPNMTVRAPKFEKLARLSLELVAVTEITFESE